MIRYNVLFHLVPMVAPMGLCGLLWTGQIHADEIARTIDRSAATKHQDDAPTAPTYRVTRHVEGSVTVVRYERVEPVDPKPEGQQNVDGKTAQGNAGQRSDTQPRWVPVRTTRRVRSPGSGSIHANPSWSYHARARQYQAPIRKRFQPRRDWTYHPAGSRTYRPKRDWTYHRR